MPIFAKILNLIQGFQKSNEGNGTVHPNNQSVKIAEKLMEVSGPLIEQISHSMKGYDVSD